MFKTDAEIFFMSCVALPKEANPITHGTRSTWILQIQKVLFELFDPCESVLSVSICGKGGFSPYLRASAVDLSSVFAEC